MLGELGAIGADHPERSTASCDDGVEFAHHPSTGQRCISDQSQALPRVVVHHGQHPDTATIGGGTRCLAKGTVVGGHEPAKAVAGW